MMRRLAFAASLLALAALPAFAYTGTACLSTVPDDHAACIALIGAVRVMMTDENSTDPACTRANPDDMRVTDGVIDWIRSHPERQGEDLANLAREALLVIDPCTQRSLIPETPPADPIDTE
ncbi:hypothetical protein [Dongia rigui]|uniref:Rap1a immunity protein domain-containing protein n=1 Tax=Dongia rigui TaxID=940149 RepID=A0ABU5E308_9PROT|nr:hypothetical protein [Dongia rigui]MDY0874004.1 hypothetical protein [Dongia rigui]